MLSGFFLSAATATLLPAARQQTNIIKAENLRHAVIIMEFWDKDIYLKVKNQFLLIAGRVIA
jgi:hypothetical protein